MANKGLSRKTASGSTQRALTKQAFISMLNARREMKYFTDNDETTVPVNATVTPMSQGIIVGDTADARDGNQINVSVLDINLSLILNATATVDFVRFIVFSDMQSNGVYPTTADILNATDPNSSFSRTVKVTKRFKILHDVLLPLSIAGSSRTVVHRKSLKLKNHVITYGGTTSAEVANGKGSIYYYICGDEATNPSTFILDFAFSFYDS